MTDAILTQCRLKELLNYDPETGLFTRRIKRAGIRANIGDIAGKFVDGDYVNIKINGKIYKAHRLAWMYVYGDFPDGEIDHINRIKHDNRIKNLRIVNRCDNMQNIINPSKSNTCGFRGVSFKKEFGLYFSRIQTNNERIFLGYFDKAECAYAAYLEAKAKLHGLKLKGI